MPRPKALLLVTFSVLSFCVLISALSAQGREYVEEVKRLLGPETVRAILKVRDDRSLSTEQKAMKVHSIMIALPDATLRRIPFPPRMRALPAPILENFRNIALNRSLSLIEKVKQGMKVYNRLTAAQKALLPTVAEIYQPI
uniref:Uncharacterized protein n=1 Tax=Parascaris univalens TaxID=6257 RepID=A0A915AN86_PARUN